MFGQALDTLADDSSSLLASHSPKRTFEMKTQLAVCPQREAPSASRATRRQELHSLQMELEACS
jgi:hypothetical protein